MQEELLQLRRKGIGGSDAGIVLGLSPFKSRLQLWTEKVTGIIRNIPENSLITKLGHVLEPIIAEEYSNITGRKLEKRDMKIHSKYNFILGNVDREIVGDKKGPGILEIKTKGAFENWKDDDIPIYYKAQLQHYLEIYGYKWGSFCVLDLGKRKINYIDVERDDDFISYIVDEEIKFWDLVVNQIKPDVNRSKSCEQFLRKLYSNSENTILDLNDNQEAIKWAMRLKEIKNGMKLLKEDETECKNHLMYMMGSAEKAIGDYFSISWKAPKDKEEFDLDRFRKDHPELVKDYLSSKPQDRRFTVRFKER